MNLYPSQPQPQPYYNAPVGGYHPGYPPQNFIQGHPAIGYPQVCFQQGGFQQAGFQPGYAPPMAYQNNIAGGYGQQFVGMNNNPNQNQYNLNNEFNNMNLKNGVGEANTKPKTDEKEKAFDFIKF